MKFPKTFRMKNLDEKTQQLINGSKKDDDSTLIFQAEEADFMSARLAFLEGSTENVSDTVESYSFEDDDVFGITVTYTIRLDRSKDRPTIVGYKNVVFDGNSLVLKAFDDDILQYHPGKWEEKLERIYYEKFPHSVKNKK